MTLRIATPWAPEAKGYASPHRLIFTLALGEDVETIPARSAVRAFGLDAPHETGHGAVDRVLRAQGANVGLTRLHDAATDAQGFDLLEHASGLSRTYVATFSDIVRLDETVDALRQLGVVTAASMDYFVSAANGMAQPAQPQASDIWPWQMVGADTARGLEAGDAAVTVAVLDTGAALGHAELAGRLGAGFDAVNFAGSELSTGMELVGDYSGRDTDPGEARNPHGTACLAIIGGQGRAMPQGLTRQATMMPVRVLASAASPGRKAKVVGLGALSDIDYAIKRSVDLGAKVLNCSFGTSEDVLMAGDPKPHEATTSYALARGAVMVAASGNSGQEERYYPAAADDVIAVGSHGPEGTLSAFSTRGGHVALSAPGERILTPSIDGYQRVTGTSFASPFVAGAAALLVSRARAAARPMTGAQVREILTQTADPWRDAGTAGGGVGTLNIPRALAALDRSFTQANALSHPATGTPVPQAA
ncbi:MAG: S8 family serine peptidase [Pseudomonadota bacterium]